jgi:polysaccharide export outer membrane protein
MGVCCSLGLSACTGFLPEGGPGQFAARSGVVTEVGAPADHEQLPYLLISPTLSLAKAIPGEPSVYGDLGPAQRRADIRPAVGDVLLVTIFESQTGGLFTSPQTATALGGGGNFVNLPRQAVDAGGNISVPYAGVIRVAGRSLIDIQKEIENKLKSRAIEPQVIVSIAEERASTVSVLGRVGEPRAIPVGNASLRILDAIARANGVTEGDSNVDVMLQRGRSSTRVSYRRLISSADANIAVLPGDIINVVRNTRGVNVLGASGRNIRVPFDIDGMTLADSITRAEGLSDQRADATSVFVVRMEDTDVLRRAGVETGHHRGTVPTVYQVPFSSPAGLLLANNFKVRDRDVVYVANASGAQLRKLLELIGIISRSVSDFTTASVAD